MNVIICDQLHELVMKLPVGKLTLAYALLADLTKKEDDEILPKSNVMNLPGPTIHCAPDTAKSIPVPKGAKNA